MISAYNNFACGDPGGIVWFHGTVSEGPADPGALPFSVVTTVTLGSMC